MSVADVPSAQLDGRTAAVQAVAGALAGRQFVSNRLRQWRAAGRLDGREAGLAMEIGQGAIRHRITIEHALRVLAGPRSTRSGRRLHAILLTASYQIIWMDRIPVYAAVDQAVELARKLAGRKAAGLVNAVLRRLSGAIVERRGPWRRLDPTQIRVSWDQACQFNAPVLPDPSLEQDSISYLAAATGERLDRYRELVARYGPKVAEAVAWSCQAKPPTVLHRNSLRIDRETFVSYLQASFGPCVEVVGDAAFLPGSVRVVDTPLVSDGLAFVQDTTAHAAARALEARPGQKLLDLCAAPGGKSVVLALDLRDQGEVLACDPNPRRLARVSENIQRLKLTCVRPQTATDAGAIFDAALVDVPCSNSGVIARRPEARFFLTRQKLRSLVRIQRQLLQQAAGQVRAGGRLVYSTCSLEPAENEQILTAFLKVNPDWILEAQQSVLPAWGPRLSDWHDGGFFARLARR